MWVFERSPISYPISPTPPATQPVNISIQSLSRVRPLLSGSKLVFNSNPPSTIAFGVAPCLQLLTGLQRMHSKLTLVNPTRRDQVHSHNRSEGPAVNRHVREGV